MKPRKAKLRLQDRPGRGRVLPEPLGVSPDHRPVELPGAARPRAAGRGVRRRQRRRGQAVRAGARDLRACWPACCREHLDPDAVAVVEGGPDVSTALLEQRFDHIFFTGSTAVGRIVAEAAAKHLTPTLLELGGKSPAIVGPDVEPRHHRQAPGVGQGPQRRPDLHRPRLRAGRPRATGTSWSTRLVTAIDEFYGPDPSTSPDLAQVVNERHAERLTGLLADHGGTVACGGAVNADHPQARAHGHRRPGPRQRRSCRRRSSGPSCRCSPSTTSTRPSPSSTRRPKPLALYVFTDDDAVADRVIDRTSSGGVCVNHVMFHIGPPDLPFGGVGDAGHGRYHGQAGFDALSNLKPVYAPPVPPRPVADLPALHEAQGQAPHPVGRSVRSEVGAAVDVDRRAGQVRGPLGEQERDHVAQLLGAAGPARARPSSPTPRS